MIGKRQPDRTGWFVAERHQRGDLVLDLGHSRGDRLEEPFPRRRRADVSGRARQEADTHAGFQLLDRVAEGRLRDADLCCRFGEALLLGNDSEPGQLVEIRLLHVIPPIPVGLRLIDHID